LGVQDTRDKFLRLQADFDNFRKRTAGEKDALRTSVKADTVGELLPLVDNFELAKTQLKLESEGEKKVDAAYQGLYKQMVEIFRGLGLEAVPGGHRVGQAGTAVAAIKPALQRCCNDQGPRCLKLGSPSTHTHASPTQAPSHPPPPPPAGVGSPFDPSLHDAIMREASDQVPDGTVLEEFRKGFTLGDRLLRPAMVKVSYNDAAPAAPQPDSSAAADAAASDGSSSGDSSA
jgi:molecular chaperone GrpE